MKLSSTVRIELQSGTLWRGEEAIHLTPNEQAVLGVLVDAKGRVVSRGDLNLLALGYHARSSSRALDATIQRLRKKLERDPGKPVHLLSLYGKGYRLVAETAPTAPPATPLPPAWLTTRFVGREEELHALGQTLRVRRSVALCGTSGAGKSRLAAEYLRRQGEAYPGGRVWADISTASTAAEALGTIAAALELASRRSAALSLAAEIGRALDAADPLLLVVDGAERTLGELAPILSSWRQAPSLHLLLTTRLHESLAGWATYTLEGLPTTDAVDLLRDRTDLALDFGPEEAAQLVGHLDGLPLAIEFAATRMRIVGMRALLRALDRDTPGSTESPALVDAVMWALGTLSSPARDALKQAAVFVRPFRLEAFEGVCDAAHAEPPAALLGELLDHHLLRRESLDGEVGFSVYGAVRRILPEPSDASRRRHAEWFAGVARRAPEVWAIDAAYMGSTRNALGDVVRAWRWAHAAGERTLAAELALGVSPYLHHAGSLLLHLEILEDSMWEGLDDVTRGRLFLAQAGAHMANTDEAEARSCLVRAWYFLRHRSSVWHGRFLHMVGKVEWRRKPRMDHWFHAAVAEMEAAGDLTGAALIQSDLAQRTLSQALAIDASYGPLGESPELERARMLASRSGSELAAIMVDWARSYVDRADGQVEASRAKLESVRDRFVALGSAANAYSVEISLAYLAWWSTGDYARLSQHLRAARRIAAGFVALRLDLVEAAAHYEAVLDERARPAMVRALSLATRAPELADDLLSVQIRLALLDREQRGPAATAAALTTLGEQALARGDHAALSEIEVAKALVWAEVGRWSQALEALDDLTPPDANHAATPVRTRLILVLRAAVESALGMAESPETTWREAVAAGPGRLGRIARAFLAARGHIVPGAEPDHAPRGVILPHEVLLAERVAERL